MRSTIVFTFGALGTALTYVLWNKGVGILGAGKAGVFMNIVPFSTAIIATLLGVEIESFHIVTGLLLSQISCSLNSSKGP